jgi:broad specificity phosphatase PhoE
MGSLFALQAAATAYALANFPFKACFSSTIRRAAECADIIWEGVEGDMIRLDSLREANLGWLQGMTNAYAKKHHPDVYGMLESHVLWLALQSVFHLKIVTLSLTNIVVYADTARLVSHLQNFF